MAFSLVGLLLLSVAATFADAPRRRRAHGNRIGSVSSRIVARRPDGLRRTARPRAVAVPGRRQCRLVVRTAHRRRFWSFHEASRASRGARCWRSSGMIVLWKVGGWNRATQAAASGHTPPAARRRHLTRTLSRRRIGWSLTILAALIFSKYFYLASLTSYYTFYLISRFHVSVRTAQIDLFVFLAAVAAGTIARRADRRSFRQEIRHLGINPRCPSLHAVAAVCEPVLDLDSQPC